MTREEAKTAGENLGIFMVWGGRAALYMPLMRILVDVAVWVNGGAQ